MNDALEELIKRLTSRCEASVYDGEPAEAVKDMLRALTPEDLDALARRYRLVLARDVGRQIQRPRWDIEGRAAVSSWNKCRAAMLNWHEAEVGDE